MLIGPVVADDLFYRRCLSLLFVALNDHDALLKTVTVGMATTTSILILLSVERKVAKGNLLRPWTQHGTLQ